MRYEKVIRELIDKFNNCIGCSNEYITRLESIRGNDALLSSWRTEFQAQQKRVCLGPLLQRLMDSHSLDRD